MYSLFHLSNKYLNLSHPFYKVVFQRGYILVKKLLEFKKNKTRLSKMVGISSCIKKSQQMKT